MLSNIQEIRNRLRTNVVNVEELPAAAPSRVSLRSDDEYSEGSSTEGSHRRNAKRARNPPPPSRFTRKEKINDTLGSNTEEEEKEPESEIWVPSRSGGRSTDTSTESPDLDPEGMIESERLNAPEYDWRYVTRKGCKSRENFKNYLIEILA